MLQPARAVAGNRVAVIQVAGVAGIGKQRCSDMVHIVHLPVLIEQDDWVVQAFKNRQVFVLLVGEITIRDLEFPEPRLLVSAGPRRGDP